VLTRIFGPKRDEVREEWRKLYNEGLKDLYSSPKIVRMIKLRRMKWAVHEARMKKERTCTRFWWGNLKGRGHRGNPGVVEDNFNMDCQEVGCGGRAWMEMASGRDRWWVIVNAVMKFQIL